MSIRMLIRSALGLVLVVGFATTASSRTETLRWRAGTGSATPAAGFKVYVGLSSNSYNIVVDAGTGTGPDGSGVYQYDVDINAGAYQSADLYVAMRSYSSGGEESGLSNERVYLASVPPPQNAPDGSIDSPASGTVIAVGASLNFSASGSDPDGDSALSYSWNFDSVISGVSSSSQEDPGVVRFDRPGTFSVRLDVQDSTGRDDPTPASVIVVVMPLVEDPGADLGVSGAHSVAASTRLGSAIFLTTPEGDPRLFVVMREGLVRVVEGGAARPTPFLDLRDDVSSDADGGLTGLAFDPSYASNGYFFVSKTNAAGDTMVRRYQVSDDPYLADPASGWNIITLSQPQAGQNGGHIAFGPDGFLYLGTGDGGGDYDPGERAQDGGDYLGKILRLDVSVPFKSGSAPSANGGYAVPADNPFFGSGDGVLDEIWALGLRNPYRFSFDRQTGDLWLADQGQASFEEVNFEAADSSGGLNYGWDVVEGMECVTTDPAASPDCQSASITDPVFDYEHSSENCGIVGGFVYRGSVPELKGQYFFADECSGRVWSLDPATDEVVARTAQLESTAGRTLDIVGFGEDDNGELHVIDSSGTIYMLGNEEPACGDGLDNDGDGFTDFPEDPGCFSAVATTERPICDDGFDNDLDSEVDLDDGECGHAWENIEHTAIPSEALAVDSLCGLGAEIIFIFPPLIWLRQRRRARTHSS